jgi:hypothetical protein
VPDSLSSRALEIFNMSRKVRVSSNHQPMETDGHLLFCAVTAVLSVKLESMVGNDDYGTNEPVEEPERK